MVNSLLLKVELSLFRKKWRKFNSHNFTYANNLFPIELVSCGNFSYGPLEVFCWKTKGEKLLIGNLVSIAKGVKFVLGGNHNINNFFTYPFNKKILKGEEEAFSKGPIEIQDDVWIGMNSMILSGVKIGQGAVIGAGSIVASNIPPYAIVVGNPARIIKYRFDNFIVEQLLELDFSKIDSSFIKNNCDFLYSIVNSESIENLKKRIIK